MFEKRNILNQGVEARKRERRSLIHKLGARNQWNKMSIQSAHFRRDINYVKA